MSCKIVRPFNRQLPATTLQASQALRLTKLQRSHFAQSLNLDPAPLDTRFHNFPLAPQPDDGPVTIVLEYISVNRMSTPRDFGQFRNEIEAKMAMAVLAGSGLSLVNLQTIERVAHYGDRRPGLPAVGTAFTATETKTAVLSDPGVY